MSEDPPNNRFAIPFGLPFRDWQLMVRGLAQKNANTHPVSNTELSTLTTIPSGKISSNLNFLRSLSIITPESKGSGIVLTEKGFDYANALVMQDTKKQNELLAEFSKTGLRQVIEFCELHKQSGDLDYFTLFNHIKLIAGINDRTTSAWKVDANYKYGIEIIMEMLVTSQILDESFLPSNNKDPPRTGGDSSTPVIAKKKKEYEVPTRSQHTWLENLFKALKDVGPDLINRSFIGASVVGNNHEGSVLRICKFLDISKDDDTHGENYERLRYYGADEFPANLGDIIRKKYSRILQNVNLGADTAKRENLVATFMREYKMDGTSAESAVELFLDLCSFSDIQVSPTLLGKTKSQISKTAKSVTKPAPMKTESPSSSQPTPIPTSTMPTLTLGVNGLEIKINVTIDAKEPQAFTNTLEFIKALKSISDESIELQVPVETSN